LVTPVTNELVELLGSMFKADTEEIEKFTTFTGNVADMTRPEMFLYESYSQLKRIPDKLNLLLFRVQFPTWVGEAKKKANEIVNSLKQLHSENFKKLLMYVLDVSNVLSGGKTTGFRFSSLAKLMELKSPADKKSTLLHFLVERILQKDPSILEFAGKNLQAYIDVQSSMAFFQALFPTIVQKFYDLEVELYYANENGETEYAKSVCAFKQDLRDTAVMLNEVLHEIDQEICFFGNNENDLPETPTIVEIRKMWNVLQQKDMISKEEAVTRTKRDEDRFTFFTHVERFLQDIKKAQTFIQARNKKTKQNEEYQRRITSPPNESKETVKKGKT